MLCVATKVSRVYIVFQCCVHLPQPAAIWKNIRNGKQSVSCVHSVSVLCTPPHPSPVTWKTAGTDCLKRGEYLYPLSIYIYLYSYVSVAWCGRTPRVHQMFGKFQERSRVKFAWGIGLVTSAGQTCRVQSDLPEPKVTSAGRSRPSPAPPFRSQFKPRLHSARKAPRFLRASCRRLTLPGTRTESSPSVSVCIGSIIISTISTVCFS